MDHIYSTDLLFPIMPKIVLYASLERFLSLNLCKEFTTYTVLSESNHQELENVSILLDSKQTRVGGAR